MDINSKLERIYRRYWDSLMREGASIIDPCPTNPMVLNFDEPAFSEATKKIMICGQETWGWDVFGESLDHGLETYRKFFINRKFYDGYGKSAFWKAFRFFERELPLLFEGEKVQFIYQNISKIGRNDGETGVTDAIRALERKHFPVLSEEMKLLQPDIVLFLSGPNRDHDIRFHFPNAKFKATEKDPNSRRLAWISDEHLPEASLRLYHPNYFKAWTYEYRENAIELIKNRCLAKPAGGI